MAASLIVSEFLIIPQTKFAFGLHTAGDGGSKIEDLSILDGGDILIKHFSGAVVRVVECQPVVLPVECGGASILKNGKNRGKHENDKNKYLNSDATLLLLFGTLHFVV